MPLNSISDDSETVYDPVPPPKSADEERNGVYELDARTECVIDAATIDEDRLDLNADDIHQPSADALPDVLPKDQPEPSDAPETSPAAQEDTEPVIVACLPPSLASEVYASLTPAKYSIKEHSGLDADKNRAEEVTLRYRHLFKFVDIVFVLAISADVNGSSSCVDNDDTFISL